MNPNSFRLVLVGTMGIFITACGPNQDILRSAENKVPAANVSIEKSSMEQDLDAMRTADFAVVFVLRRKDRGEFDAQDRAFVRDNTAQANRRVAADNSRAVIVGSNFALEEKNLSALKERFIFEDHSPQPPNESSNTAN
jgi:hypothetical protein